MSRQPSLRLHYARRDTFSYAEDFGARILSSIMPLHKRHYNPGQLQFITASTYRRAPLFLSECFRGGFVETLAQVRQEMTFLLIGWVLMPDHFHLLLKQGSADLF